MSEEDLPTLNLPENFTKEDVQKAITDDFVKELHQAHQHSKVTAIKSRKVFNGPGH